MKSSKEIPAKLCFDLVRLQSGIFNNTKSTVSLASEVSVQGQTKYFLKGMSGEGDKKPYGNSDGKVSLRELKKYLDGSMTYYARRYYGRTQTAQIVVNGRELSPTN